jgi:hypothetical protein
MPGHSKSAFLRLRSFAIALALAMCLVGAPHPLIWNVATTRAGGGDAQAACQSLKNLFGGDVFTGKYKGTFSAALEATDARVPGLKFTVALSGTLEVDVGDVVKTLTGASTYQIKGRAPGLAHLGGAFNLDVSASGDLSLQGDAKQRFVAGTTNDAYGDLLGKAGDIVKDLPIGASKDDVITFVVANSDCRGADGTFTAQIFDAIRSSFAGKGLAVNDTQPPTWHVDQADPDLEQKIGDYRAYLNGLPTSPRSLNLLTSATDELKSRFDEDHRACGAAVLLDWIASFLPTWIDEASRELSDALGRLSDAADANDASAVAAAYKEFEKLAGEVSVYEFLAGALGINSGSADQATSLAESVLNRYIATLLHLGGPRTAVSMLKDVSFLSSIGELCTGGDPKETYVRLAGHFIEEATAYFAAIVEMLQQDPGTALDAESTAYVVRMRDDEVWVRRAFGDVPRALNDYCDSGAQC